MILVLLDPRPMDGKISFFCLPSVRCHFRQQSKMKTNVVFDISPPIPVLAEFWFSIYGPKWCQPVKLQNYIKCNISKKKWMMNCIFGLELNIKVLQVDTMILGVGNQACQKYPKKWNLRIFVISPERYGKWSWFFACRSRWMFSLNW